MALVLLDLNGVLCDTINKRRVMRKGNEEFVEKLLETYDVAIFSSTMIKNIKLAIEKTSYYPKLNFILSREFTKPDGGFKTTKHLKTVFELYPKYNDKCCVIIDDSPEKLRYNAKKNNIIYKNESFEELYAIIKTRLENL